MGPGIGSLPADHRAVAIAAGSVFIDGQPVHLKSPEDAIKAGVVLVPEDRKAQGVVLDHSVNPGDIEDEPGHLEVRRTRAGQSVSALMISELEEMLGSAGAASETEMTVVTSDLEVASFAEIQPERRSAVRRVVNERPHDQAVRGQVRKRRVRCRQFAVGLGLSRWEHQNLGHQDRQAFGNPGRPKTPVCLSCRV